MEECILKTYYSDDCVDDVLSENLPRKKNSRIQLIIAVTKKLGDTLHEILLPLFDNDPHLKVKYHSNCANNYCSINQKSQNQDPPSNQRSGQPRFNFQRLCIYCGLDYSIIPDLRHKDRWR